MNFLHQIATLTNSYIEMKHWRLNFFHCNNRESIFQSQSLEINFIEMQHTMSYFGKISHLCCISKKSFVFVSSIYTVQISSSFPLTHSNQENKAIWGLFYLISSPSSVNHGFSAQLQFKKKIRWSLIIRKSDLNHSLYDP